MLTPNPLVSVVVCSYDRQLTLSLALESVASQETGGEFEFEVVVIDDGSTDETREVVRRVSGCSAVPVRYIRESGRGIPFARNRGVEEARGEWIAFFDDDQIAEREWLRELTRTARGTGAQIVGGVRQLDYLGEAPSEVAPMTREVLGEKYYGSQACRSNRYTLACTGNVLVRRELFDRIGQFDTNMHRGMSDIDLMRRAFDAGVDARYTPHAVVRHLIPPYRLGEDYLKWTSLRTGTNLSVINHKSWGTLRMFLPCLLRVGHALTLNAVLAAVAYLAGRPALVLGRKCYRWMAEGSARMALHLALPQIFPQEEFLDRLAFRGERCAFEVEELMDPEARAKRCDASWVTVVISTRDRATEVTRCVASVLRNEYPSFDLLVVDQSSDSNTEEALRTFQPDPRVRYVRSETKGLSAGRNLGIRCARGEMIACTDDDCEMPLDWLSRMAAALRHEDRTAVVFGNVRPGAPDRAAGLVLGCVWDSAFLARSIHHMHRVDGISGCMGLRRRAWERLGGFDELLGAGAPFPAAEEMDFAIRALLAGFYVYAAPEVEVLNYGFRSWDEERKMIHGYLYGIGAMIAKHLKCGNWGVLHYVAHLFWRWAVAGPVVEFGHRPPRWLRLRAFLLGVRAGLVCAVERPLSLYRRAWVLSGRMAFRGTCTELERREQKRQLHDK